METVSQPGATDTGVAPDSEFILLNDRGLYIKWNDIKPLQQMAAVVPNGPDIVDRLLSGPLTVSVSAFELKTFARKALTHIYDKGPEHSRTAALAALAAHIMIFVEDGAACRRFRIVLPGTQDFQDLFAVEFMGPGCLFEPSDTDVDKLLSRCCPTQPLTLDEGGPAASGMPPAPVAGDMGGAL